MHEVNLQPLFDGFVNPLIEYLLQGAAIAVASYIGYLVQKFCPPFIRGYYEKNAANELRTALQNGVLIAMHKVQDAEKLHSSIEVKGAIQAYAAQYAIDHTPAAVRRFGLDPDTLATKALAYIPTVPTTTDTTGATVKSVPVIEMSLPPIGDNTG